MSIILKVTAEKNRPPLRGFDHYWSVIMDFAMSGHSFTIQQIFDQSNTRMSEIKDFILRLVKAQIIEADSQVTQDGRSSYRVLVKQSATPKVRRDGTVIHGVSKQQAIWNYMRSEAGRLGFTAQDINVWQRAGEDCIKVEAIKSYIRLLFKAGYLLEVEKGRPGKFGTYRLQHHMNTGPKPPIILRARRIVFDQNRNEAVGQVEAVEVKQ